VVWKPVHTKIEIKKRAERKGNLRAKAKKIMTRGRLELPTLSDMDVKDT
jgi:hypothetical protein